MAQSQTISSSVQSDSYCAADQTRDQRTGLLRSYGLLPLRGGAHLLTVFVGASLAACTGSGSEAGVTPPQPAPTNLLFAAHFNGANRTAFETTLLNRDYVALQPNAGPDGSAAVRVTYAGSDIGSPRITARAPLRRKVCAAMLQFDVRFDQDWIWVKSGKLHGVGPAAPVTGGQPRKPSGWSSRTTFHDEGKIAAYLYDQTPNVIYGVTTKSRSRVFTRGQWHRVRLYTTLNGVGAADGSAVVTIDGIEALNATGVMFRAADDESSLIQQFLFSTFYGGNNVSFAPKDADGNFATVTADFDNFEVYEMPSQSTCAI